MAEDKKPAAAGEAKAEATKPAESAAPAEAAPAKKADKKKEKKGKRVRTGKKHFKADSYKLYKIEDGKAVPTRKPCPRCGPGTWLAEHKGRQYCGRCAYTIFQKKG